MFIRRLGWNVFFSNKSRQIRDWVLIAYLESKPEFIFFSRSLFFKAFYLGWLYLEIHNWTYNYLYEIEPTKIERFWLLFSQVYAHYLYYKNNKHLFTFLG